MKRRRKQFTKTTASRNALSTQEPKKRFGKKQKKKLIIISLIVLVICLGISYFARGYKAKKAEEAERARKGELIETEADKMQLDHEGNEIVPHKDTEIHIINVGDGCATLIKKGHYEVLVDAGGEKVADYLAKHVDGELEYLIITNRFSENNAGEDIVKKKFKVSNYIYNNYESSIGEAANGQTIDMGENLSVTVVPGISGDDYDKSAIVTVTDEDKKIYIVGNSSAQNIATLKSNEGGALLYINGGKPNVNNTPLINLKAINPEYIISSTKTKLSADYIENVNNMNGRLYATYISKNMVFTINESEVESTLEYDDQIRPESESSTNAENNDEEVMNDESAITNEEVIE